ncbi:hemolysin [Stenotrophomonas maltophilia]|nr:hemolysin [Stenotrophomonas maltophilia]MBH1874683.1 hemolysin [Stenotrophomonas maltophilia]
MASKINGFNFEYDGSSITLTYKHGELGGKATFDVEGASASVSHGRGSVGASSDYAYSTDSGFVVSGQAVTLGLRTPSGAEIGLKLTPNGEFRPHPTDPFAPPIPSAQVDLTLDGKMLGSYDIPLYEDFTMDDLFDPELGGLGSHGLLGDAYGFLRHRDREINDQYRDATGENFQDAKGWTRPVDPLVLDLDGDGIETVAANGRVLFDHEGNAVREGTGWISADDGMLVLDRNGNGTIDDGSELFGDHTPGAGLAPGQSSSRSAGLRALATLDQNGDGRVDESDEAFASLQVWRDLNQDGVSQANELFSLRDLGIRSISVDATSTQNQSLGNGNTVDSYGSFERIDGTSGITADLLLASNNFHRDFLEKVPLSDLSQRVANLQGSGMVRDLREAVSLNPGIFDLISKIDSTYSRSQALHALDEVLLAWSSTSSMKSSLEYQQAGVDRPRLTVKGLLLDWGTADISQILSILEKFNGELFFEVRDEGLFTKNRSWQPVKIDGEWRFDVDLSQPQTTHLLKSYEALKMGLYTAIMLDTRLRDYAQDLRFGLNEDLEVVVDTGAAVKRLMDKLRVEGSAAAVEDLLDLRSLAAYMPLDWNWVDVLEGMGARAPDADEFTAVANRLLGVLNGIAAVGGAADDVILGTSGDDVLDGGDGNDEIRGGAGNDLIEGGKGSNTLYGGAGNDTLSVHFGADKNFLAGGAGDDVLIGSAKSDTYLFNKGDGHDTIVETAQYSVISIDTLVFGVGLRVQDLKVLREGRDILLVFGEGEDSVRLKDWLTESLQEARYAGIERFLFADGTEWSPELIRAQVTTLGSDGDDVIDGWLGNDLIRGGAGNDLIDGGGGTNELYGEAGNDTLKVHFLADKNILAGGVGNDTLIGSSKSDTYLFNKGDGHDTIVETGQYASDSVDTLVLGEGLSATDVRVLREGRDVVLSFAGGSDTVRLKDWLTSSLGENTSASIEKLVFADGTQWTAANIRAQLTTLGTSGDDKIVGWNGNDLILGGEGDDVIEGGLGSNELHGGAGNDTLSVAATSDLNILAGGIGNDTLIGSLKSDTYLFNKGDGHDTIVETGQYASDSIDTLVLGEGLQSGEARFLRQGNDLQLSFAEETDSVTFRGWFGSTGAQIEVLSFADGRNVGNVELNSLIAAMAQSGSAAALTPLTIEQTQSVNLIASM